MSGILDAARDLQPQLVAIRRHLHQHPELSGAEFETAAYVASQLRHLGLEVETNLAGTPGLLATLRGARPGRALGLHCEMDAVAVEEETGLPFASRRPGVMHACGHDAHMAVAIGVARLLAERRNLLDGDVRFLFLSASETGGTAGRIVESDLLQRHPVDAFLGLTLVTEYVSGVVAVRPGAVMAGTDVLNLHFIGPGGNIARPHEGTDAIEVAAEAVADLYRVVARVADPLSPAAFAVTWLEAGRPEAQGVLASRADLHGTLRYLDEETGERLRERMRVVVDGLAYTYGVEVRVHWRAIHPPVMNDRGLADLVAVAARSVLGDAAVSDLEHPLLAGKDFGHLTRARPGCLWFMGVLNPEKGIEHPPYSGLYDLDEDVLWRAAAVSAETALGFLSAV